MFNDLIEHLSEKGCDESNIKMYGDGYVYATKNKKRLRFKIECLVLEMRIKKGEEE